MISLFGRRNRVKPYRLPLCSTSIIERDERPNFMIVKLATALAFLSSVLVFAQEFEVATIKPSDHNPDAR